MEEEKFDKPSTDEEIIDSDSVTINADSKDSADGADGESIIINSVNEEIIDSDSVTSNDGADGANGTDGESIIISVDEENGMKINVPGVNINFNISKFLKQLSNLDSQ